MTAISTPDTNAAFGQVDLTDCDREPIHVPGCIQSYGVLLVLEPTRLTIKRVAGDTSTFLGHAPEALLDRTLAKLFGPARVKRLRALLAQGDLVTPLHAFDPELRLGKLPIDASVHKTRLIGSAVGRAGVDRDVLVVEFEAADLPDMRAHDPLATVQQMLASMQSAPDLDTFCQAATEQVRRTTGYDRVMIYRFLPEGEGAVIAESRGQSVESYLGLRYPASDIPRQARDLFLRNWLRIIADVDYVPAPLLAATEGARARSTGTLDMSQCSLRAASPIHLEYLRNMGVAASMTISIMVGGRLWGLIACHHTVPKRIPRHLRASCELFGHMFSFQLEAREQAAAYEMRHRLRRARETLVQRISDEGDLARGLIQQGSSVLNYVDAGGAALLVGDAFSAIGRTPSEGHVRTLIEWLAGSHAGEAVFATASLSSHWEAARDFASDASGMLALAVARNPPTYILWFRPEVLETVCWGGNPDKAVEIGSSDHRLSPRTSFEAYSQSVRLHAEPWAEAEVEAAQLLRLSLLEIILRRMEQVARERNAAQARHEVMLAELNHRVKNTLATVQALARHSKGSAATLDAYVHSFEQRIQAMAASHNLLSDAVWQTVELRALIVEQLLPYAKEGDSLSLDGDRMILLPRMGTSLGMVFHELATNAAKYGALSVPGGRVRIRWNVTGHTPSRVLRLSWREEGGPPVKPWARQGFGSFVTQRLIAYEMQGSSEVLYKSEGVCFYMEVPETALVLGAIPGGAAGKSGARSDKAGAAPRILLVEDDALLAHTLEEAVRALGWTPVGPVGQVEAAMMLALVEAGSLNGAVLDIHIDEAKVWPVAEALQNQGVPFLFATAYDRSRDVLPTRFAGVPILSKPFVEQQLMDTLLWLVAGRGSQPNGQSRSDA
ncbi:HWE histidine kinase domain-containing protein [Methylobacterium nigriterrae]|uniref:HWE histidine kinase domain-containing protein n=1 Tax=Methylobacterium nigriterrae TaxID=3127512 RepID=UPI0030139A5B